MPKISALVAVFSVLTAGFCANADTVAFFYALDGDLQGLKAAAQTTGQSSKIGSHAVQVMAIGPHRVYAIKMGSGVLETTASAQALLTKVRCDEAFSVGPIGDISDKLLVRHWYAVSNVVAYQKGSWTEHGFEISPAASMNLTNTLRINLPPLFQNLTNICIGSGEVFVASDSYRTQINAMTGADGVDMNLYGLNMVCSDFKLPLYCWRIVSDHADNHASEDFKKFVADYDGSGGKAVAELIRNLPPNPNSPDSYPNLKKIFSNSEK